MFGSSSRKRAENLDGHEGNGAYKPACICILERQATDRRTQSIKTHVLVGGPIALHAINRGDSLFVVNKRICQIC